MMWLTAVTVKTSFSVKWPRLETSHTLPLQLLWTSKQSKSACFQNLFGSVVAPLPFHRLLKCTFFYFKLGTAEQHTHGHLCNRITSVNSTLKTIHLIFKKKATADFKFN